MVMVGLSRASPRHGLEMSSGATYIWLRPNPGDALDRFREGERWERCRLVDGGDRIEERLVQRRRVAEKSAWLSGVVEEPCSAFGGRMIRSPVSHRIQSSSPSMTRKKSTVPERTQNVSAAGWLCRGTPSPGASVCSHT